MQHRVHKRAVAVTSDLLPVRHILEDEMFAVLFGLGFIKLSGGRRGYVFNPTTSKGDYPWEQHRKFCQRLCEGLEVYMEVEVVDQAEHAIEEFTSLPSALMSAPTTSPPPSSALTNPGSSIIFHDFPKRYVDIMSVVTA